MTKKMIFLVMITFSLTAISQNSVGIGKLKLYSPISIVNEIAYDYEYQCFSDEAYEIFRDSVSGEETSFNIKRPVRGIGTGIRTFFISRYEIIPDLEVGSLYLVFNNDKLISIKCESNNTLCQSLDLKYGKSINVSKKGKSQVFKYPNGKILTLTDKSYVRNWNVKLENVTCKSVFSINYNKKDEIQNKTFILCDNSINSINTHIEMQKKEREKSERENKNNNF